MTGSLVSVDARTPEGKDVRVAVDKRSIGDSSDQRVNPDGSIVIAPGAAIENVAEVPGTRRALIKIRAEARIIPRDHGDDELDFHGLTLAGVP